MKQVTHGNCGCHAYHYRIYGNLKSIVRKGEYKRESIFLYSAINNAAKQLLLVSETFV